MVIDLLGVLEDGYVRAVGVPSVTRRTLLLPRGVDLKIRVRVVSSSGALLPLVLGTDNIEFTVRKRPGDAPLLKRLAVASVPAEIGHGDINIVSSDWNSIDPIGNGGRFLYDVWLQDAAGNRNPLITISTMILEPAIASPATISSPPPVPPPPPPTSGGNAGTYTSAAIVAVRDVVYLSASDTVDRADADGVTTQPVIGICQSKPTSTTAVVQYSGELVGFSGLVTGATYYMDIVPGQITLTPPSMVGSIVQRVGFAKDTTTLVIQIDRDFVEL